MDWNLKAPSWDLGEFQQETSPHINRVSGSSSFEEHGIMGGFSVDLKLGQVVDLGNESADNSKGPSGSKMEMSHSGSSKRARAVNNGIQAASCLVDGCNADLSSCREYHRRHKVCELHSKTPEVTIRGHKQRFCQQCSRFHSLEEFDDGKRSCRKRLDGHNRRRRKPQPDPLSRSGAFVSNYQASRLFPFSAPQVYPTTALPNPVLAGVVKAEQDDMLYNQVPQLHLLDKQNIFPGSSSCSSYKGEKQFSFLHSATHGLSSQTVCQPLLQTIASSSSGRDSHQEMLCDSLSTHQVLHSDCALSLLSSPTTQTSGIGLSHHIVQPSPIPVTHPSGPSLRYNSLEPMNSVHVSTASDTEAQCQGMFHVWPDSSSDNETPHALPFYWE